MSGAISRGQLWLIHFYKKQLEMMITRGLGGKTTASKTEITPEMISSTRRRLKELEDEYETGRDTLRGFRAYSPSRRSREWGKL